MRARALQFRKNHYPILKKLQEQGHILLMSAAFPRNHANEPARWDMRFTIVFRDVLADHLYDDAALIAQLYPDQATFKKDIPVVVEDAATWK